MIDEHLKEIKSDFQIKKFCAYGFLKDLRFFEPYLLIFLMGKGIDLFQIGILIAIREVIVNLFEIPSGIVADYFGRKKELDLCFGLYIISFLFFFFTNSFFVAIFAMVFYGLGEAFRSGTHKAMIYTYLDSKGWQKDKTFVYGKTRSCSLIGGAISSIISILIILNTTSLNCIFLFSIIPYVLDFILILTYPKFLDCADKKSQMGFRDMFKLILAKFHKNNTLKKMMIEEGMFEATISFIKDLIQPILELIIVGSGFVIISTINAEDNLKVILGIVYAFLNLLGSIASRNAYMLKFNKSNMKCLYMIHFLLAISMAILAVVSKNPYLVFGVYLLIYLLFNVRKPIFVDEIDEHIEKSARATALSVTSQLKALFLIIFAPILGYIADRFGLSVIMLILAVLFIITLPLLKVKK